jgi:hypothetical protein
MPAVGSSSSSSLWLGGQRTSDLQPALVAVGQVAGQPVALALQADEAQQPARLHRARRLLAHPPGAQTAPIQVPQVVVLADEDVLERAHVAEEADVLVGPGDAQLGDLVRPEPVDRDAVEGDLALVDR